MKAAIYARVSTSNGSETCENQLLELRRYCDARAGRSTPNTPTK